MSTELPNTHAALTVDPEDNSVNLFLPRCHDDATVPDLFIVICACASRMHNDPEWCEEMIEWFMTHNETIN